MNTGFLRVHCVSQKKVHCVSISVNGVYHRDSLSLVYTFTRTGLGLSVSSPRCLRKGDEETE